MFILCWIMIVAQFLPFSTSTSEINHEADHGFKQECEVLQQKIVFTQDESPRDIGDILKIVNEKVQHEHLNVVKVSVLYPGNVIHGIVGIHDVTSKVIKLEKGKKVDSCIVARFEILDVDECTLPVGHKMRHSCHHSAECVNTIGDYICRCPRGEGAIEGSGRGFCGGRLDTAMCCAKACDKPECLSVCKADFRCPSDPCPGDCTAEATCERVTLMLSPDANQADMESDMKRGYKCICPPGTYGNGRKCLGYKKPILWVTPKHEFLVDIPDICGCQSMQVDPCYEKNCGRNSECIRSANNTTAKCKCKTGFKFVEKFGCVDETLPLMSVSGPNPMYLKQCDAYEELGLKIIDENSEEYGRSLEVEYSKPLGACLRSMGDYEVNYTVQTPWTSPPYQRITRRVVVEDVDECSLPPFPIGSVSRSSIECDDCRPRCHPLAKCINTIGSYTCQCPKCTTGDGFVPALFSNGEAPMGYISGTGCRDSCAPVIELQGSPRMEFKVCKCEGLLGRLGKPYTRDWESELSMLIKETDGKGLCDGVDGSCVKAYDDIGGGHIVDVTPLVFTGAPIRDGPFEWRIPYDVTDDSGNRAETVFRTVVINEMSLEEYGEYISLKKENRLKFDSANQNRPCPKCPRNDCANEVTAAVREVEQRMISSFNSNPSSSYVPQDSSVAKCIIGADTDVLTFSSKETLIPLIAFTFLVLVGYYFYKSKKENEMAPPPARPPVEETPNRFSGQGQQNFYQNLSPISPAMTRGQQKHQTPR